MIKQEDKLQLQHTISTITVTDNLHVRPYIDTFAIAPKNIIEREHGLLVGFFRIYDDSEDSAYIANFLTSVLKKEFYASMQRPTEESLEAALKKVNATLGEMIRQGDTQWIDMIDGAITVFAKDSLYFSTCGEASVLLFRNNVLTSINKPTPDKHHVLTTFSDIAHGPIYDSDTVFVASRDLLEVLPLEECELACQRYTLKEREQLFRTALVNNSEGSCMHIISMVSIPVAITHRDAAFDVEQEKVKIPENVFSANTFKKNLQQSPVAGDDTQLKEDTPHESQSQKDTHIYLQGNHEDMQNTPFSDVIMEYTASLRTAMHNSIKSTTAILFISTKNSKSFVNALVKSTLINTISISKNTQQDATKISHKLLQTLQQKIQSIQKNYNKKIVQRKENKNLEIREKNILVKKSLIEAATHKNITPKEALSSVVSKIKPVPVVLESDKNIPSKNITNKDSVEKFFVRNESTNTDVSSQSIHNEYDSSSMWKHVSTRTIFYFSKLCNIVSLFSFQKALPSINRVKKTALSLTRKQQAIATGIIVFIIIIPFIFTRQSQRHDENIILQNNQENVDTLLQQENVDASSMSIDRTHVLHTDSNIIAVPLLDNSLFAVTKNTITKITNANTKEEFSIPSKYGNVINAVAMSDLNLILLLTDKKKVISFSSVASKKFADNAITLPLGLTTKIIGTYRTYLYFVDTDANAIYRYPRSSDTGGFGAATNWLTDTSDIDALMMTIDGSIYTVNQSNSIDVFFKHKKETTLSVDIDPSLAASSLFTKDETSHLFIADRETQRIISIDKKTGTVKENVSNTDFAHVVSFSVDERLKIITALLDDGVIATYKY